MSVFKAFGAAFFHRTPGACRRKKYNSGGLILSAVLFHHRQAWEHWPPINCLHNPSDVPSKINALLNAGRFFSMFVYKPKNKCII
jgi:hypothetical protein